MSSTLALQALVLVPSDYTMTAVDALSLGLVSRRVWHETDVVVWLSCLKRPYLDRKEREKKIGPFIPRIRSWSSIDTETSGKS